MATQRYTVTPHPIETLLTWVRSGEIAIPEIQRPFVWDATKVRNLLDSLYRGYPVGYLIALRNPTVKLKDGSSSAGKRVLIDGQQRVTALMAALLGQQVVTKDYEQVRIRIAFNPLEEKFEVSNPAIAKNAAWIKDVVEVFKADGLFDIVTAYCVVNPGVTQNDLFKTLEKLRGIRSNLVGVIELGGDLDIETVTEIFIRVNSAGAELSQADFAMSKIASNESFGGNTLRKAIDYFCHLAVAPDFYGKIRENDTAFAATDFFQQMAWVRNENDDIYDPSYTDMLRVAFTSEFKRGKLADLVALLSGRNFETKQFEESIAEVSFAGLKQGGAELYQRDALQAVRDDHSVGGLCGRVPDRLAERTQLRLYPVSDPAEPGESGGGHRVGGAAVVCDVRADRPLLGLTGKHVRFRHSADARAGLRRVRLGDLRRRIVRCVLGRAAAARDEHVQFN
jgi:Protein of unknown function DUF262